jgi:hypothetical protein
VSIEPSSIELEEFELVQATPGTVLLRVTARAPASIPREPTLLVDDGEHVHRVRPLPSPPDPDGWLRAAYSLRSEILDDMPAFMLEVWPGAFFDLPDPLERGRPVLRRASLEDTAALIELEAAALEANRTAVALQAELEHALDRAAEAEENLRLARGETRQLAAERDELREALRELHEEGAAPDPAVLEAADRAWEGVAASITSLRKQFDRDLERLEEELRAARLEAAAAREGERAAKADADRMRADAAEEDPEMTTELIREAAEDRVQTEVENEIRAALAARSNPANGEA